MIALPLLLEDQCIGTLTIYAPVKDAFYKSEAELLQQLANDLAFGIMALRTKSERAQLQRDLLTISEREKEIISQELHDGLCQNLAATAMIGSLHYKRLAEQNHPEAENAKKICEMLCAGVNEARHLSHGLQPVGPEADGLMHALKLLAITTNNLFCIPCSFECPKPVPLKNKTVSTHLFRIAQEAITNARKHGQAEHITIRLEQTRKELVLTIQDNGIGLPKKLSKKRGMGLKSMSRRAEEIGATLTAARGKKKGTIVTCTLKI